MEYSWKEPLCLIKTTSDGLQVSELTLQKLLQVKLPIAVVAIVGPYRTGKSYLLNLLAGSPSG